jgi:(1->4)-alpha-D-glucan 1-alpha-D-glucosylmutase
MMKALNEAKINTSWVQPNEEWLAAMRAFIAGILEASHKNKFFPTFFPIAEEIARLGAINSLSQILLKFASPGVPDIYQGNEIWDFSLVDPDNRRPVDYQRRREMLDALCSSKPEELLQNWPDGRIKMFLTHRALYFRNEHAELFRRGNYLPITASGMFSDSVVSFARELDGQWLVIIAPRLTSRVGFPPIGEKWNDTAIELPEALPLANAREVFRSRGVQLEGRRIALAEALSLLPFAAITNTPLANNQP